MKILFICRSTYLEGFGGDSIQMLSTAKYLRKMDVEVDIKKCNEKIDYSYYDLIHIFNIIRPADSLVHTIRGGKPYVISSIFLDYEAFEKNHRKGILKWMNRFLSKSAIEYMKSVGRHFKNGEKIVSPQYWWLGHKKSIKRLYKNANMILPNSHSEYFRLSEFVGLAQKYKVIYNGIDHIEHMVSDTAELPKDKKLVLCVARIEGNKNQYRLIKALNNTEFHLKIIGKPAPNHRRYYEKCKKIAASNVEFCGFIPLEGLIKNYRIAKVHILPSYSETCGLSSLEAAYHQCSLVITKGGDTEEYFQKEAFYCNPNEEKSILEAVRKASKSHFSENLYNKTKNIYTWKNAAKESLAAYRSILGQSNGITGNSKNRT